jgi:hypothetical protein
MPGKLITPQEAAGHTYSDEERQFVSDSLPFNFCLFPLRRRESPMARRLGGIPGPGADIIIVCHRCRITPPGGTR